MITVQKQNTISRKGVKSEGKFQIKATGKAFRILSDGLYSDKIKAIMRELSCNAYDAHVEAKTLDKPFKIHLPNKLEPKFTIRDFGIGLSHNDVVNVYTTYFESTKTDSNDYIGCLGLGSKSPFSYVDNFTIISYLNGEKRIYNAFLNEDETPTIALLSEGETDEPNGVEVSFPVQSNDTYRFEEKASEVFTYFKLRPEFTGAKPEINEVNYELEGSNWGVRKSNYGSAKAVMGNIAYNLNDFSGDTKDINPAVLSLIKQVPIDIFFNIGDLEVAASRESLSYNKRTIAKINEVLSKVVEEIRQKASEKIKNAKTLWDARVMANDIREGEFSHLKVVLEGQNIFKWKNQELDGGSYIRLNEDWFNKEGLNLMVFTPKTGWRRRNSNGLSIGHEHTAIVHATKGTRLFWNDINKGSHIRCKQVIADSGDTEKDRYGNQTKAINRVYLVHGSKEVIEKVRKELGIKEILPISTIQRKTTSAVYKQSEYNPKNSKKLLIYNRDSSVHKYYKPATYWEKGKVSLDEGGIYVNISRYKINGTETPDDYIDKFEDYLMQIGQDLKNVQIVGVKDSMLEKIHNHVGWKSLREYVTESVKTHILENNLLEKIEIAKEVNEFQHNKSYLQALVLELNVDKKKPCGLFIEKMKQLPIEDDVKKDLLTLNGLIQTLHIELPETGNVLNIDEAWAEVVKAYPLFDELDTWGIRERRKEIEEYINIMDIVKFKVDK